ncbi:MAG: hypothetical protein RLZZ211_2188 [Bacteroidota bacterium]
MAQPLSVDNQKKPMKKILFFAVLAAGFASCTVVRPHQVAVKSKLGKIDDKVRTAGPVAYNPLITKVIKVNVRTMNLSIKENLPSKEGLTILSESSILYHIKAEDVPKVIKETGLNYEENLILPVFRSAASDVCSRYYAKDMHSAKRNEIEQEIEAKLEAEQEALRMEFVLDRQKKEMDRQLIEAEGAKKNAIIQAEAKAQTAILEAEGRAKSIEIEAKANKAANDMLNSSLTPNVLKMNQIQAFMKLSTSPNTKTIITDGKGGVINMLDDK